MTLLTLILISLVALIHLYIVILEVFLWTKPKGMKVFGIKSKAFAEETKVLAANQGLYNGFLLAGLIYALITSSIEISVLFLTFVIIAGIYGAYSTGKIRILYIQSIPALLAIVSIFV